MVSKQAWAKVYAGFDTQDVGPGTMDPNIYATKKYAKLKVQQIFVGGLNHIQYVGHEHDKEPLALVLDYEPRYNTIIAINLHYLPISHREKLMRYIIKTNKPRIKSQLPIVLDYKSLVRTVPSIRGAVRRYKRPLSRVLEVVPLVGWGTAIQEKSKWSNHYRKFI